jgi:predicted Zn-dependent peptidase
MRAQLLRDADTALNRALHYAVIEQQRGNARFAEDVPRLLTEVTADQVRAAAAALVPGRRAVVEVVAGGGAA